jgi:hypothetical protein
MFSHEYDAKFKTLLLNPTFLTTAPALIECERDFPLHQYSAQATDQFVVISSMNFTALDIAAELATIHQSLLTPQVIFIDNSRLAEQFWSVFCEFMQEGYTDFKDELEAFLVKNRDLICPALFSTEQKTHFTRESFKYICRVFEKYDLNYMRNLILQAAYVRQNWSSIKTFTDLKEYFFKNEYDFTFVFTGSELMPSNEHESFKLAPVSLLKKRKRLPDIEEAKEEDEKEKDKKEGKEEKDVRRIRFGL